MSDPRTVKKSEIDSLKPDLPEAGYKRDEELARRKGELDEALDKLPTDSGAFDLSSFPEDREIRDLLSKDFLDVSNAQRDYVYVWQYAPPGGDPMSRQAVMRKKVLGWEIVTGNMPECKELDTGMGTRRLGDTILMRIRREQYARIEKYEADKRARQQGSVTQEFDETAEKDRRIRGHNITSERGQKLVAAGTRKSIAAAMALHSLTGRLKGGTIPGLSPQKAGRGR